MARWDAAHWESGRQCEADDTETSLSPHVREHSHRCRLARSCRSKDELHPGTARRHGGDESLLPTVEGSTVE